MLILPLRLPESSCSELSPRPQPTIVLLQPCWLPCSSDMLLPITDLYSSNSLLTPSNLLRSHLLCISTSALNPYPNTLHWGLVFLTLFSFDSSEDFTPLSYYCVDQCLSLPDRLQAVKAHSILSCGLKDACLQTRHQGEGNFQQIFKVGLNSQNSCKNRTKSSQILLWQI